jgi:hypothetical protein
LGDLGGVQLFGWLMERLKEKIRGMWTLPAAYRLLQFWTQRATEKQRATEEQPIQVVSYKYLVLGKGRSGWLFPTLYLLALIKKLPAPEFQRKKLVNLVGIVVDAFPVVINDLLYFIVIEDTSSVDIFLRQEFVDHWAKVV